MPATLRSDTRSHTDAKSIGLRPAAAFAFTAGLVTLWSVTHRYIGLGGDAELYAVQAMARVHPYLSRDLFLRSGSQDNYTIFSPLYAWCIHWIGLRYAALALAILFKVWLFAAAWALAKAVSNSRIAFMAVVLLIITVGSYGAYGVFRYAEDWLTARSLAEALAISAIALHFFGFRAFGLLVASLALVVHPIMALPCVLVLICLWSSTRISLIVAVMGIMVALSLSLWALHAHSTARLLSIMDTEWLEVVRERSVFLFPQLWQADDWKSNARPFLTLTMIAVAVSNERVRNLCIASMLVGATGLAVALIAGMVGPVAIMIQCQAWRWMWVACFLSVLLLAPAAAGIYREGKCGPICAMLLIAGWIFPPIDGNAFVGAALLLWLVRERIDARIALYLRWAAGALGIIIVAWAAFNSWSIAFAPAPDSGHEALAIARIRNILGLGVPAFLVAFLFSYWIGKTRSLLILAAISLVLGVALAFVIPGAFKDIMRDGAATEINEFADWRTAIPPTANVYVAPAHNSATFAWFTLDRPSYLSVDQSAGVVFSRETAMEVKRRSQVLLPLMDPDWRLLTGRNGASDGGKRSVHPSSRPLTQENLVSVCRDTQLSFVVAKENVGFDAIAHKHIGDWKDWHLYDCGHVRSVAPSA